MKSEKKLRMFQVGEIDGRGNSLVGASNAHLQAVLEDWVYRVYRRVKLWKGHQLPWSALKVKP